MLLRICLIIAIVGGLAAAVVNFVMVKNVITTTITERDTEKQAKETAQTDLAKTKTDLANTKKTLTTTTRELTATKSDLETAKGQVSDLEKKSADLHDQLTKAQAQRDASDAEIAKWNQLHITPEGVVQVQDELKKTIAARDGMIAENKILSSKLAIVTEQVNALVGTNNVIPLEPVGLVGKVVAVDPKYDFVVLNIGEENGLVAHGIMLIAREGKLIAKIQIARVDKNQSIGTLLPEWTRGEVMEGDQVLD